MSKIISFSPVKITKLYLDRIAQDMPGLTPSATMQKIIAGYFVLKYGEDKRNELRDVFMKEHFNE